MCAAIIGERWVDIAGFDVTRSQLGSGPSCFDNVAQAPADASCGATTTATAGAGDPRKWVVVGDKDHAMFRLDSAPLLLSYRLTTGEVKLYDTASDAEYTIGQQDGKRTIFHLREDYMWLDHKSPYVGSKGDPKKDRGP